MQCLPRTVDSHSGKCFISIYISNPGLLHCRQTLYHLSHQGSLYPLGLLIIIIMIWSKSIISILQIQIPAAAAKSLQSCLTPCDPIEGSPSGSTIPGILQARTLEWVAISFSNAWKWKVKVKSFSCFRLLGTPWTTRLLRPWGFPGKSTGMGCHHLLRVYTLGRPKWKTVNSPSWTCVCSPVPAHRA